MRQLGARIRHLREKKHWSQEHLEDKCDHLTRGAISAIENGKAAPKITTLWDLAHHLDTTVLKLLSGIKNPFQNTRSQEREI